jgi:predicted transcriptional regulator
VITQRSSAGPEPGPVTVSTDLRAVDVMAVDLLTVDAGEGLLMTWELVSQAGVHHVPVLEQGHCIGLLAERDLALEVARNPLGEHRRLIRELIDDRPAFVDVDEPVAGVAAKLLRTGKDAVLVHDDAGRLIGLVTGRDLLRALAGHVVRRSTEAGWDQALTLFRISPVLPPPAVTGGTPSRAVRGHEH